MYNKILLLLSIPALASSASAVSITLDFSHATSGFFVGADDSDGGKARAAVQAAADDISAAITTELNAMPNQTINSPGVPGGSSVRFTTTLKYTNPDSGVEEIFNGSLAENEFKIFVGAQALTGTRLGQGGTNGFGLTKAVTNFTTVASHNLSTAAAAESFNATIGRGSNISLYSETSRFSDDIGFDEFFLSMGPTIGNLWFDDDHSRFHLDHTTDVADGKSDLYSIALHEILHSLGVGIYDAWDDRVEGEDWTGSEVLALLGEGGGEDLLHTDDDGGHAHIAEDTMSARLSDGVMQEVVMDPDLVEGERKELTQLDMAFLRDLGWETVPVPEPSSTLLLGLGSLTLIMRRRK